MKYNFNKLIGYGNCIKVCKKYSISYYGHEMNCDVFIKAKINITTIYKLFSDYIFFSKIFSILQHFLFLQLFY